MQQHSATGKTVIFHLILFATITLDFSLRPDEKRSEDKKLNKEEEEEENRNVK